MDMNETSNGGMVIYASAVVRENDGALKEKALPSVVATEQRLSVQRLYASGMGSDTQNLFGERKREPRRIESSVDAGDHDVEYEVNASQLPR